MKKCPQCGREYNNTMIFRLDNGAELLYGPETLGADESATAIIAINNGPPAKGCRHETRRHQRATRSQMISLIFADLGPFWPVRACTYFT